MWKWFKAQSASTKGMVIIAIALVIGIVVRWDYISGEVGEAFASPFRKDEPAAEAVQADSLDAGTLQNSLPLPIDTLSGVAAPDSPLLPTDTLQATMAPDSLSTDRN